MTIMSGTMAFAVNADENANVLTAENAVIVENGIPRIISSAEAEKLLADGQEAETVLLHEQEQIIHDESIVDTYQTARATEYNFKVTNQATALWASDQKRVTPMVVGPATISSGESHTFTASYSGGITFTPAVLDSISATINLTKSASSNSSFTVTYTIAAGKTGYVVFTPKKRTTVGTLEEFSSYGYKTYKITVVDPVKISAYADGLYVNPIEFNFLDISMSLAFFPKSLQNKFGFCLGSQRQLPKRDNTLYLWPRSKGWMRAVKRTFNLQRLKSQI